MTHILKGFTREKSIEMCRRGFAWFLRKYKPVFFVLLFSVGVAGASLWYYSLYYYHWTDEKKEQYRNEVSKGTVLNMGSFRKAIEILDERERRYSTEKERVQSFFVEPLQEQQR